MIKYPDYDNSILSVISSILKYYGYDNGHKTSEILDKYLENKYENIVLMLFDGMGVSTLKKYLKEDDFLIEHMVDTISSVCPSTTACAIPTVESGMAPIEHSWLGWDMYFKEYDANICVFKNTYQDSNEEIKDCNVARKYINYYNVFDRIKDITKKRVKTHDISKYSDTNEFAYSCEQMLQRVVEISKDPSEDYIYTYVEEPDLVMHALGTEHEYVRENIKYINSLVCEICEILKDTLVIVIADHGLVDTQTIYLEDYPKLQDMLERRPSIESRAVNFYVKEEYKEKFKEEFENKFKDDFILLTKEEVYDKNLFGTGIKNPRIDNFVGDYIAFAISDKAIEWERDGVKMCARHAGLTKEEMEVPLIVIDTNKI